jgi:hypothetical protein
MNLAEQRGSEPFQAESVLLPPLKAEPLADTDWRTDMKTMNAKTLFAALAAVATVTAAAAPAAAQTYRDSDRYQQGRWDRDGDGRWDRGEYRGDHRGYASERVRTAERRIESGLQSGQLTRREAAMLRDELRDFARLEAEVRYGGVSPRERAQIERRWDRLVAQIRYETRDREYGYGYGRR